MKIFVPGVVLVLLVAFTVVPSEKRWLLRGCIDVQPRAYPLLAATAATAATASTAGTAATAATVATAAIAAPANLCTSSRRAVGLCLFYRKFANCPDSPITNNPTLPPVC